ncbi:MAG TPA: sensor domain-containing diguanylate cyclase [Terracidiphilus sp.]|nr:sensor domain-containing diguanylate cyclase [Terracidiphilus sp.]
MENGRAGHGLTEPILLKIIALQTEIAKYGIDLAGVTATVVERLPSLTNADGAILEYAERREMVYRGVSGIAQPLLGLRVKRAGSLSGLCVKQSRILYAEDTESDPRVDRRPCRRVGIRSIVIAPLNHNLTTVGVLKIVSTRTAAFTDRDMRVLEIMSELIAASMYNAARTQSDELYVRATTDGLTGLANRALFYDRLRQRTSNGRRRAMSFGLLSIDLDGLKGINDRFGHRVGDAAIRETALRIRRIPRKEDTVARIGGDEFGVILESPVNRRDVSAIADRIAAEVMLPFRFERTDVPLSASIGVALYPDDGISVNTLIDAADRSMYAFKNGTDHPSAPAA